jgi:hypothetical protein
MENKKTKKMLCAIQWQSSDWEWLAEIAHAAGLSRSAFVRKAAMAAATATANGVAPYFVGAPKATTQNTRIGISGDNVNGNVNAGDRCRGHGVSQGSSDDGRKKSPKAKGQG